MTAAERLIALTGAGGTAAERWRRLAAGAATGAVLVAFSGLASATAAEHLLHEAAAVVEAPHPGGLVRGKNLQQLLGERAPVRDERALEEEILAVIHVAYACGVFDS
jgi:hypothetical protein